MPTGAQEQYEQVEGFQYDERLSWRKVGLLLSIGSNVCVILQGLPGAPLKISSVLEVYLYLSNCMCVMHMSISSRSCQSMHAAFSACSLAECQVSV